MKDVHVGVSLLRWCHSRKTADENGSPARALKIERGKPAPLFYFYYHDCVHLKQGLKCKS